MSFWGVALFKSATGEIVQVNSCMSDLYGCQAVLMDAVFSSYQDEELGL